MMNFSIRSEPRMRVRITDFHERTRRRALLLGLACTLAAGLMPALAGDPEIVFISPRHLATAIGPTAIELRVNPGSGARVERVEITVDETPLVTLTGPPWKADWDAGDASRGHDLAAVMILTDGRRLRSAIHTSPLRINQFEEVGLVNLYTIVRDRGGNYVPDLTSDDFRLLENGVEQTIARFSTERKPLHVGIVLDTSLSMARGGKLDNAQKAALEFLDLLAPADLGMVVTFDDNVQVAQPATQDKAGLASAISATEARGGTALYDAVWRSAKQLEEFDGRRVLVLLSDGRDEAANGFEPGSLHTRYEAQDQALRSEVMVFAIGLGKHLDEEYPSIWERPRDGGPGDSLQAVLQKLADATGGRALFSPGARQLRKAFRDVADDLRNQYSLAYRSSDEVKDGSWREIELLLPESREVQVITRKGYYAKPPTGGEVAPAVPRRH